MKTYKLSLYNGKVYITTITIMAFSAFTAYFKAKNEYPQATTYQICNL
jgi:hypothetical protein